MTQCYNGCMQRESHSVTDTYTIAKTFIEGLQAHNKATVVGLSGDLGSGKTTFMKGVADALGITEHITSPTFVIMKIYPTKNDTFTRLVHIDAYRLEKGYDLVVLGFEELLDDPHNLICIEWPERIEEALPRDTQTISFTYVDKNKRVIILKNAQDHAT